MRILHINHRYWPCTGGSERHVQEISERLVASGHAVTVYTTDALDLELLWNPHKRRIGPRSEINGGVAVHRFPVRHMPCPQLTFAGVRRLMTNLSALPFDTSPILRRLAVLAPRVPEFRQVIGSSNEFDLVHSFNVCFDGLHWPALAMARRNGVPFVITPFVHLGEDDNRVRRYYTMRHQLELVAQADAVLAQTEIERQYLIARGVSAAKIVTVGSGVNPEQVLGGDGERFRSKYGIPKPFVFSLGATAFDKGTFHVVKAMSRLWQQGVDADLVLAGPTMDAFERFYHSQPDSIKQRCHVLQFISEDDKRDLLAAGAVMALPSRTDSFGIVYLEAWLYGKPVLGARAGGVPEVVDDGVDGFLTQFGDEEALSVRLAELLAEPDMAREMGERGRRKVLERHTWDRLFPIVGNVVEQLHRSRTFASA